MKEMIKSIKYDEKGLIPVVTQDYISKEVLMLAYMNEEALQKTLDTNQVHYYSRSRKSLWLKGETSGHFQNVKRIAYDCDMDTLLIFVAQVGSACHTGEKSCFYRNLVEIEKVENAVIGDTLPGVYDVIKDRQINPKEGSYTNYLFEKGMDKMLKKVGEESAEVIIGAKNNSKEEVIYEASDLLYHLSVVFVEMGITWGDIAKELEKRR